MEQVRKATSLTVKTGAGDEVIRLDEDRTEVERRSRDDSTRLSRSPRSRSGSRSTSSSTLTLTEGTDGGGSYIRSSDITKRYTRRVVTRTDFGTSAVNTAIGVGNAGAVKGHLSSRTMIQSTAAAHSGSSSRDFSGAGGGGGGARSRTLSPSSPPAPPPPAVVVLSDSRSRSSSTSPRPRTRSSDSYSTAFSGLSATSDASTMSTITATPVTVSSWLTHHRHTPGDELNSYRRRIDANVEQQREHADLMAGLQRKVEDYRRRIADIESHITTSSSAAQQHSTESVAFSIVVPTEDLAPSAKWAPETAAMHAIDYEMSARLDAETRRSEEYRFQCEQLKAEIQHLRQQFELNLQDKERIYQNRERNLAQYLSEEQRKMMDLWVELQQVRRQCAEFKEQTEVDLENQRNEFLKVIRSVSAVSRQLNLTASEQHSMLSEVSSLAGFGGSGGDVQDAALIEAIARFRELKQKDDGNGGATTRAAAAGDGGSLDSELNKDLLKKYEDAIERVIELESRLSGDAGDTVKIRSLETDMRLTSDRLTDCLDALNKINSLSRDDQQQLTRAYPTAKRSRSLSPGGAEEKIKPAEVVRNVRLAIRARDNDLQQFQRKHQNTENEIHELVMRCENAEGLNKRFEKQLSDSKKEIKAQISAVDELNREAKRLEDRLRASESDRVTAETARRHLEDEIRRLKLGFDQSLAETEKKASEETEERHRLLEDEYKTRIVELSRRIDALQDDCKQSKLEQNEWRDKFKNLEVEYSAALRKLDEKDGALKNLDRAKTDLLKELNENRERFESLTTQFDNLQTDHENSNRTIATLELRLKEIQQQRDVANTEKGDLQRHLNDLKRRLDAELKAKDDLNKSNERNLDEIGQLKAQLSASEHELLKTRRQNDQLDTQQKICNAKITTLDNSLGSAQREINKLNELNAKLQKEKNEILNLKQRSDADLDKLRERIRKVELELEKVNAENKKLNESEQKAQDDYKTEVKRAHLLQQELGDNRTELDEIRSRLQLLDQESRDRIEMALQTKQISAETTEFYERTRITEIRLKEAGDKYKLEVEKVENERDDLLGRVRQLEDELHDRQVTVESQERELDEMKVNNQLELDRLKAELTNLEAKYQNELDDERDQFNQNLEGMKAEEENLRNKLTVAEKKLADALEHEKTLKKEASDWETKYTVTVKELHTIRDQIDTLRDQSEKEIQQLKNELFALHSEQKTAEMNMESLKTQLNAANDRNGSLNKTIHEHMIKIRQANTQIDRLEQELQDAKCLGEAVESDLERSTQRLKALEEQYAVLQLENNELRTGSDNLQHELDTDKNTIAAQASELERLKKKLEQVTKTAQETQTELEKVRSERDRFENINRDSVKQVEQLSELVQTLEARVVRLRQELKDSNDKLRASESERSTQSGELKKQQQELQLAKEQQLSKTEEFRAALDELSSAHRKSEDARVNAIQALESRKFELNDVQSRLDNAEQRLVSLQQDYLSADKERDLLSDQIKRFQLILQRSFSMPIPEGDVVDVQTSLEVHLQKVVSRIEKLERERNEYRDSLTRQKRKTSDSQMAITKQETIYRSVEEKIADVEEGKRTAELRLTSAKQLLKSQEDTLKQRDEERRAMKAKIVSIELESRGKDAQIRHLNKQVKELKKNLESAQHDLVTLRDRSTDLRWQSGKIFVEKKLLTPVEKDTKRIQMLTATFEAEKQALSDSLKKLTARLDESEGRCADLTEDTNRMKKELARAERGETELKRNLEEQTRLARDAQHLRDQLVQMQIDLTNSNNRKQYLENELSTLRSDLRDQKQSLQDASSRITELQRQLQDVQHEKTTLNDKLLTLEKTISQQRSVETDLRQQLTNERRATQAELDDLRRRLKQLDADRSEMQQKIEELTTIRLVLIKKIDILETEKKSAQAIIDETASQRAAIETSLNALERENKELCRNCAHLQQQIVQLEMDSGSRLIAITNKQRDEHERFVQSVKAEKVQVERIIENRDRVHKSRVQQLEGQLNTLREQLAEERRRHRDMADRIMINDMSKMSTAASAAAAATWGSLGSYTVSTAPVSRTGGLMAMTGTQLQPQKLDSSFDSLFGSRGIGSGSSAGGGGAGGYVSPFSASLTTTRTSLLSSTPTSGGDFYRLSGASPFQSTTLATSTAAAAAATASERQIDLTRATQLVSERLNELPDFRPHSASSSSQPLSSGDSDVRQKTTIVVHMRGSETYSD